MLMRAIFFLSLALVLNACSKQQPAPEPAEGTTAPTATTPVPATAPEAEAEAAGARQDVAIDEPLPPFEEDSGIVMASRSPLKPADASLAISGDVFLYEAPDGSRLVRLENLKTPRELRVDVALSRSANPGSAEAAEARVIGGLKGSSGNMNYLLEGGYDLKGVQSFVLLEHGQPRVLAAAPFSKP